MKTIDWNEEIKSAIKNQISYEHYRFLLENSRSWVTCAVGNQCSIIPRDLKGTPLDKELHWLGAEFCNNITDAEWKEAKKTLKLIEIRSTILISEIKNYKN